MKCYKATVREKNLEELVSGCLVCCLLLLLGRRSRNVSQHLERRARVVDGYLFIVVINIKTRSEH